jgi:hypothetical protein
VPQDVRFRIRFPVGYLEVFQVTNSFCRHSVPVGSTQSLMRVQRDLFGEEGRPALRDDFSAVQVLPNFKVRKEAQLSVHPLNLLVTGKL